MASTKSVTCRCGTVFQARTADIKRGWGKFCSKRCKAIVQEANTGQYATLQQRSSSDEGDWEGAGWDAHKDSF